MVCVTPVLKGWGVFRKMPDNFDANCMEKKCVKMWCYYNRKKLIPKKGFGGVEWGISYHLL